MNRSSCRHLLNMPPLPGLKAGQGMAHAHCTQGVLETVRETDRSEPDQNRGLPPGYNPIIHTCNETVLRRVSARCHADKPDMYYYCYRSTMSAAWPGAERPQSCCGGGGGGRSGQIVNGNGIGEITEWECDPAACTGTRGRADGAWRGGADGEEGPRCTGRTGREAAQRKCRRPSVALSKRRGCSSGGGEKRACFSATSTAEASAAFHCGGSEPDSGTVSGYGGEARVRNTLWGSGENREVRDESASFPCDRSGAVNGERRRGCRTARGRVRLCRVRSFLASAAGMSASGAGRVAQLSENGDWAHRPQHTTRLGVASSTSTGWSGARRRVVNGGRCAVQVEASRAEAEKRQVLLGERTDVLWRRLHAVQVKQVERHVTQQLGDLRETAVTPSTAELSRLARTCSGVLRTAGGALDSDHTGSSSDTEEEKEDKDDEDDDDDDENWCKGNASPSRVKSVCRSREWRWIRERAWLGSRWVWLQAQVSELEYGIRALTELYMHLRQEKLRAIHSVPETPLRAPRPSPAAHDCRFRKRLAEDSASSSHTPQSGTSSAARVRPLLHRARHRLIRWEDCPELGTKDVSLPCCCEPPAVCVLCGPPHPPADGKSSCRRHKGLDQCLHPVLSMPSDFPQAVDCVTPLPAGHGSNDVTRWMREFTSSCVRRRGQGQQKVGRVRRRLVGPRPPSTLPPLVNASGASNCKSYRGVVSSSVLHQHAANLHLPGFLTPTGTPTQPLRRRRGESSYDIDNLVMPLGLAGLGARVQKLQYKEIITPSWRELDSAWGVLKKCVGSDGQCVNHSDAPHRPSGENEMEDVSDTVFLKRHAIWESRERSRWGSWARRRHRGRSSSSLSNGRSCSGWEQVWSSLEHRQGEMSPCSSSCSAADDPFYQMEEEQQCVQPWERRSFPLLEEELRLLQENEEAALEEEAELEEEARAASGRSQSTDSGISVGSLELSPRTPQPRQLHSGCHQTAIYTTQDSDSSLPSVTPPTVSFLPSLTPPTLSSLPSVTLPSLSSLPFITRPTLSSLPSITPPTLSSLPSLTTPTLPSITSPTQSSLSSLTPPTQSSMPSPSTNCPVTSHRVNTAETTPP
ncbi:uncharacterized protein LOC124375819 isoform X2 [Silurus meridionalis]|uniref:PEHE domain-containing protein n=1 Tax=Silurus meridionalis TaxID=175797 RepID=A0A8T0AIL0_SILME|nr:uncharacterized protein LOC124375819 isoform X2 [Silurus meridionalis]KAF7691426.1 hypothetical protein HF521_011723 [Silurus meridionalis]